MFETITINDSKENNPRWLFRGYVKIPNGNILYDLLDLDQHKFLVQTYNNKGYQGKEEENGINYILKDDCDMLVCFDIMEADFSFEEFKKHIDLIAQRLFQIEQLLKTFGEKFEKTLESRLKDEIKRKWIKKLKAI